MHLAQAPVGADAQGAAGGGGARFPQPGALRMQRDSAGWAAFEWVVEGQSAAVVYAGDIRVDWRCFGVSALLEYGLRVLTTLAVSATLELQVLLRTAPSKPCTSTSTNSRMYSVNLEFL